MFNKQHINDVKRQHRCNKSATVVNCYKLSLQTAQFVFLFDYSKTAKPCGAKRTSSWYVVNNVSKIELGAFYSNNPLAVRPKTTEIYPSFCLLSTTV